MQEEGRDEEGKLWRCLQFRMDRRLKELERENGHLKRAVANLTVDNLILEEAAKGNF